jgi:thiamine pyrophosphate-dependent acetolactate synthase large subunit-like protein
MDRREATAALLQGRCDLVVVTGLGSPSYDAFAAGDHPRNFYLWGAMGGAVPTGFGLALARKDVPVLVLTGDGEALMGLGALATAGAKRPPNLTVAVLDNGHYGETGMQASHTGMGVDLEGVARSVGFAWSETVTSLAGIDAVRPHLEARQGLGFVRLVVAAGEAPRALPTRDGHLLVRRVREALGAA